MTKYKILGLNDNNILIIVLSLEMTQQYWDSLQLDLKRKGFPSSTVYIDFLYRNGNSRRFLQTSYDGDRLMLNGVATSEIPAFCREIADTFFYENNSLYKGCVLSLTKQAFYLNQIRKKYNLR